MEFNGAISTLPKEIRIFVASFVVVLSIGFYTGLLFVNETSSASSKGIEENYLGNEDDEDAEVMKFKKSDREMLTIVHTHILSMSMIFFLLGLVGLELVTEISSGQGRDLSRLAAEDAVKLS